MITSDKCWMKDKCKKYLNLNKECECRNSDIFCTKLFKLDALFTNSCLSNSQRKTTDLQLDQTRKDEGAYHDLAEIKKNIVQFVNEGENLYIHSSICGNGKTEWAIKLLQEYFYSIWPETSLTTRGLFINVPRFLLSLKESISKQSLYIDHIKDTVLDADLVVWDEVGVKALTEYEHEHLLNLINTRLDIGKSNIYTSNLSKDELRTKMGERLYSRIQNMSKDIEFFGCDKRGLKK
jgi:DNA replication protein DnaC